MPDRNIGIERAITEKFKNRAVQQIGARLRDDTHSPRLRIRRISVVGR